MKKITIMLAIIMTAGAYVGKAQIQRGNVLVGSDLANFKIGLNTGSYTNFNIIPKAAWFIKDNTALGAYVKLGITTAKGQGTGVNYGVGALARQYLSDNALTVLKHTRFFVEGTLGIEGENASASATGVSTNGLGISVGPGLAYFITPNIGLEGLFKFNGILGFGNQTTASNLNFDLGFQIYLPGRNAIKNVKRDVQ